MQAGAHRMILPMRNGSGGRLFSEPSYQTSGFLVHRLLVAGVRGENCLRVRRESGPFKENGRFKLRRRSTLHVVSVFCFHFLPRLQKLDGKNEKKNPEVLEGMFKVSFLDQFF